MINPNVVITVATLVAAAYFMRKILQETRENSDLLRLLCDGKCVYITESSAGGQHGGKAAPENKPVPSSEVDNNVKVAKPTSNDTEQTC